VSTLGTSPVLEIHSLRVPGAGGFWADLSLDGHVAPAVGDALTLTVGDLALPGTVTQAGYDDHPVGGARPRVTLEGGAGWAKSLTRQGAYDAADGVRLSTVLRDLAGLAGEAYDPPSTDVHLPPGYGWAASTPREVVTGASVLADLMERGAIPTWRVAPLVAGSATLTGRTRFDAWPSTGAADSAGRVMRRNLRAGLRMVGLDRRVAAFLPGATLEGDVISRLHLTETGSKLEAEVYSPPAPALASWRAITQQLFPFLAGFRLSTVSGGLRLLAAASKALHLQGDAGDPAVLRVGDVARLVFDPGIPSSTPPALFLTRDGGATFVVVAQVTGGSTVGGTVPPPAATPSTALAPSGSTKVTCA
jgi:hypothetical protein